jgi:hypothetical protein
VSQAEFQIAYDGDAVRNGSMDVADLAPALLALGELIAAANKALNEDQASVSVRVESDFKTGSFEIALLLDQGLIEHAKSILHGVGIVDAAGLVKAIFGATSAVGVATGVVGLYKKLKGEKVSPIMIIDNSTHTTIKEVTIKTISGRTEKTDVRTAELYQNQSVRSALERIVRPLRRDGIDRLDIKRRKKVVESVNKDEAVLFSDSPVETIQAVEPIDEETVRRTLEIVRIGFRKGIKSRFSDGAVEFEADVKDANFVRDIEKGEPFACGDSLQVFLYRKTWRNSAGRLETEYAIAEVVKHIRRSEQQSLLPLKKIGD